MDIFRKAWDSMGPIARVLLVIWIACILFVILAAAFLSPARADPRDTCAVQKRLQALGFYQGDIDCEYGPETARAIAAFQRANGLDQDGVVGTTTGDLLFNSEDRRPEERYHEERTMPAADETAPPRDRRTNEQCGVLVEGHGEKKTFQSRAEADAVRVWRSTVGDRYGNRFVDWNLAKDKDVKCYPACSTCTVSFECEVKAVPCQS